MDEAPALGNAVTETGKWERQRNRWPFTHNLTAVLSIVCFWVSVSHFRKHQLTLSESFHDPATLLKVSLEDQ